MGEEQVQESREAFNHAKKPSFRNPESAVDVFHFFLPIIKTKNF
jgi:acetyltransferase